MTIICVCVEVNPQNEYRLQTTLTSVLRVIGSFCPSFSSTRGADGQTSVEACVCDDRCVPDERIITTSGYCLLLCIYVVLVRKTCNWLIDLCSYYLVEGNGARSCQSCPDGAICAESRVCLFNALRNLSLPCTIKGNWTISLTTGLGVLLRYS